MKIIIIALSGIGDALMFTPALKLLRAQLPDAQIDVLVMFKGAQDIFINNPNINNVYLFDFLREGSVKSLNYILSLRGNYDTSINVYPSNRKEYNIISFLIGAKNRAAVKYLRKDFSNLGFLNGIRITEDDSVHNVQTNIKLIEKLLNNKFDEEPTLELSITEEDEIRAQKFFSENNILKDDLVIGFHPGCATLKNHIKRRWETEKFAELGKKLIDEHHAKILVFGGPDEDELKKIFGFKKPLNTTRLYKYIHLELQDYVTRMFTILKGELVTGDEVIGRKPILRGKYKITTVIDGVPFVYVEYDKKKGGK